MSTHEARTAANSQNPPRADLHQGGNPSMWVTTLVLEVLLTPSIASNILWLTISHIKWINEADGISAFYVLYSRSFDTKLTFGLGRQWKEVNG